MTWRDTVVDYFRRHDFEDYLRGLNTEVLKKWYDHQIRWFLVWFLVGCVFGVSVILGGVLAQSLFWAGFGLAVMLFLWLYSLVWLYWAAKYRARIILLKTTPYDEILYKAGLHSIQEPAQLQEQ